MGWANGKVGAQVNQGTLHRSAWLRRGVRHIEGSRRPRRGGYDTGEAVAKSEQCGCGRNAAFAPPCRSYSAVSASVTIDRQTLQVIEIESGMIDLLLVSYLTLPEGSDVDGDGKPEKPVLSNA
jgi:hypothetical protein